MKAIACEMCGSQDLVKQEGMYVCQHCGTKYSVEEAKKLMIEGAVDVSGSTVIVDSSADLKNLYELARRAKKDNDNEKAYEYYNQIVGKDPLSWEAYFYSAYYRATLGIIGEIGSEANRLSNSIETVLSLIKNNVAIADEQRKAVEEVATKLGEISSSLFQIYHDYDKNLKLPLSLEVQKQQNYVANCSPTIDLAYKAGDLIIQVFGDSFGGVAAACWKVGVNLNQQASFYRWNMQKESAIIQDYCAKIQLYDPSYSIPKEKSGCYIATAVYGSYDCPQVWTLRRFRDYTLAETLFGRLFIALYYATSPTLVKWFGQTEWFKNMWRPKLDKMVERLNREGVADTPYQDRKWK